MCALHSRLRVDIQTTENARKIKPLEFGMRVEREGKWQNVILTFLKLIVNCVTD